MKKIWFISTYVVIGFLVDIGVNAAMGALFHNIIATFIVSGVYGSVVFCLYKPVKRLIFKDEESKSTPLDDPTLDKLLQDEKRIQAILEKAATAGVSMSRSHVRLKKPAKPESLPRFNPLMATNLEDVVWQLTESIAAVWDVEPNAEHRRQAEGMMPIIESYVRDLQSSAYVDAEYLAALVETRKDFIAEYKRYVQNSHVLLSADAWDQIQIVNREIERVAGGLSA